MTDESLLASNTHLSHRRLSLCRQLSDVFKHRRKSSTSNPTDQFFHVSSAPSRMPSALLWNCTLAEVPTPSNENVSLLSSSSTLRPAYLLDDDDESRTINAGSMIVACLVKQKSISCDDVAFFSADNDEQTRCAHGPSDTRHYPARKAGLCLSLSPSSLLRWKNLAIVLPCFFSIEPHPYLSRFRIVMFTPIAPNAVKNFGGKGKEWKTVFHGIGRSLVGT